MDGAHRYFFHQFLPQEHRRHIGEHHPERRPHCHRQHRIEARAKRNGGNLGLVTNFDDEKGDGRCNEGAMARRRIINGVKLVGDQRPAGHGDERSGDGIVEPDALQPAGQRHPGPGGERMIGERGDQDSGDDRPGCAKTGGQYDGEQLRFVAHFGEGNDSARGEQRGQKIGHGKIPGPGRGNAVTRHPLPGRAGMACHRSRPDRWLDPPCTTASPPSMLTQGHRFRSGGLLPE